MDTAVKIEDVAVKREEVEFVDVTAIKEEPDSTYKTESVDISKIDVDISSIKEERCFKTVSERDGDESSEDTKFGLSEVTFQTEMFDLKNGKREAYIATGESNGEDNSEVCHETKEIYDSPIGKLLRHKSKVLYESAYNDLIKWAGDNKVTRFTESALLDYFGQLAKYYKGSTLWSKYSMLKKQLVAKHNVHLAIYYKLISFIKRTNSNYSPKKSRALTREQFDDFIDNAPDDDYLSTKVILIFGVTGACRCHELKELTVDDIQDTGELVSVKISDPESRKTRSFTVVGGKYLGLYRKYAALRPLCMNHRRFFIKFQKGKCFRSVVGVQAISSATQRVASYLNLPNVNEYTGYCLRRTSAKFLGLSAHDSQIVKSDTITS